MIAMAQLQFPANRFHLVSRCIRQGLFRVRKDGAGIIQGLVEKQLKELVPQVIVLVNISTTSLAMISLQPMTQRTDDSSHATSTLLN